LFKRLFSFRKKVDPEDQDLIRFIFKRFEYIPKDLAIFKVAITHKSFSNTVENQDSNERLEFLGDAILDAVVAELLYDRFPDQPEGELTKLKSKVVSRKTLAEIGAEMALHKIMHYQRDRNINLTTLEGNAFEALMGAIYLDGGYESVKTVVFKHVFTKYIDLNKILEEEIDFKSQLYIWSQKNRVIFTYDYISDEIIDGVWKYVVQVIINGKSYGLGSGGSKKQAEQAASKETLELIGEV
jgi:ribonuclease III